MINPRSKREKFLGFKIDLPDKITVFASDETAKRVLNVLNIFLDDVKLNYEFVDDAEKAFFKIYHTPKKQTRLERYKLYTDKLGITASFECFMGGRNAMASLYQLMHRENNEISIDAANLDDWADVSHRELMLEMCFKDMPPERIKRIMVDMALSKMNVLHMHLMDNRTLALQFDAYPAANNKKWEYYTKDEMKDIIAFGKSIGIESMPEIEFVTHSKGLTYSMPELFCESTSAHADNIHHALCIGNEEVFSFYDALIKEITEIFDFPIIHVGADEIVAYDIDVWPMWYDCKRCRKKAEELGIRLSTQKELDERMDDGSFLFKGIDGVMELMMYGIKRMHKIVTKYGRRMMMWNDNIDISKPCDLPKDILIHFWRIAAKHRGPHEGCTMEKFLEQGFEIVNTHYPQTYIEVDIYTPEIPLNKWAPRVYPEAAEEYRSRILGGGPCAWGNGNGSHFKYTLASMISFYGDRLWDERENEYGKDFEIAITKQILGITTPENMNVFSALGGFILPRNFWKSVKKTGPFKYAYIDKITISKEEMKIIKTQLEALSHIKSRYARQAEDYLFCVNWALEEKYGRNE